MEGDPSFLAMMSLVCQALKNLKRYKNPFVQIKPPDELTGHVPTFCTLLRSVSVDGLFT